MAKIKLKLLRSLHSQMAEIFNEYDANCAAEKAAAGADELGTGPQTSVAGAQDSAPRGRGKSMAEAFPHFNRIKR
jgi:hypothetical protein